MQLVIEQPIIPNKIEVLKEHSLNYKIFYVKEGKLYETEHFKILIKDQKTT